MSYYLLASIYPVAGLFLMLGLVFLMPYLICASLRFNLRMTSYRNVRFNFTGTYGATFVNFILLPIASMFTLYLLLPWVLKRIDQYIVSNVHYGNKQFKAELSLSTYYESAGILVVLTMVAGIVFAVGVGVAIGLMGVALPTEGAEQSVGFSIGMFLGLAFYVLAFSFITAYYQAKIRNHILKSTELENVAKLVTPRLC